MSRLCQILCLLCAIICYHVRYRTVDGGKNAITSGPTAHVALCARCAKCSIRVRRALMTLRAMAQDDAYHKAINAFRNSEQRSIICIAYHRMSPSVPPATTTLLERDRPNNNIWHAGRIQQSQWLALQVPCHALNRSLIPALQATPSNTPCTSLAHRRIASTASTQRSTRISATRSRDLELDPIRARRHCRHNSRFLRSSRCRCFCSARRDSPHRSSDCCTYDFSCC